MVVLKRKQIVGLSLIVLVAAAGFIQWIYSPGKTADNQTKTAASDTVKTADENIVLYDESTGNKEQTDEDKAEEKTGEAQYVNGTTEDKSVENNKDANIAANADVKSVDTKKDSTNYFANARLQRENAKSSAIATLNNIIKNPDSDKAARESAEAQIIKYADAQKSEATCENIIKAKGFSDCVVFINTDNVTVVVKSQKLSESDAAKIQTVITSQADVDAKNVKIVEVN